MKIYPNNSGTYNMHELGASLIVPRPVAWVSTVGPDGAFNAAPYSAFARVSTRPFIVGVSFGKRKGEKKDTLKNIELVGDFVINVVNDELARAMNKTAADFPYGVDEIEKAGLTAVAGELVKSPRIGESPASFEWKLERIIELGRPDSGNSLVLGEVVMIHVKDYLLKDGVVSPEELKPLGRLGGDLYCHIHDIIAMKRPFKEFPSAIAKAPL
jgi:flavin reductase (DIM6/NTAB) family NADH-FMN oxidoreductase RutF